MPHGLRLVVITAFVSYVYRYKKKVEFELSGAILDP